MFFYLLNLIFENIFMVSYVSQGGSFPQPLTSEEEEEYIKRAEDGDEDARNILIERNLRLVAHVVRKYQNSGIDSDDLISIGTIGLIKAVRTYNSGKKIKLATYAARCIENEVLMVLRSGKKQQNEVSLNDPIGFDKEGNEVSLFDVLKSSDDDITDSIDKKVQIKKLYEAMKKVLKGREKTVLTMRYGLCGTNPGTQREVAGRLGISRSYVSRIEKKAIKKLSDYMAET